MKVKFISREERSALMTQAMGKQRSDISWIDIFDRRFMVLDKDTLCLIQGEDTLVNDPANLTVLGPTFTPDEAQKLIHTIKQGTLFPC